MSKIVSATFTIEFLDALDLVDPRAYPYVRQVVEHEYLRFCGAYTDEAGPLWAWGVVPLWNGVGDLWMVFDRRAERYVFRIVREAQMKLIQLQEVHRHFVRLQGQHPADSQGLRKLARLLGFQEEGILRQYGLGGEGDYVMTSRIV